MARIASDSLLLQRDTKYPVRMAKKVRKRATQMPPRLLVYPTQLMEMILPNNKDKTSSKQNDRL